MFCIICGTEIIGKRSDAKYCSKKCKVRSETIARTNKKRNELIIESKICPVCNGEFVPDKFSYKHQIYCSKECTTQQMNENAVISGRKKINAKKYREQNLDSISKRDLDYKNQIRFGGNKYKVMERDNYECQMCGNKHKLIVHHIDDSGQGDDVNNDMGNLVTLCRSCHVNLHRIIGSTGL